MNMEWSHPHSVQFYTYLEFWLWVSMTDTCTDVYIWHVEWGQESKAVLEELQAGLQNWTSSVKKWSIPLWNLKKQIAFESEK